MREYILCLVAAAAVTYLLTPLARELAKKWKVMAPVRDRDVHDTPTPLLGGLAMVGGLLAGGILASKLPMMSAVFDSGRTPLALLSGVAIIVALGVVDDKWGLDAPTKLAGQVLAAGVMAFQGIAIIWLPIGGTFVLDPVTSVLFTVLIVVISINAINFYLYTIDTILMLLKFNSTNCDRLIKYIRQYIATMRRIWYII